MENPGIGYAGGGGLLGMDQSFAKSTMANNRRGMGFLASPIAGRSDHIPLTPPSGSYVLPADVVSGLGHGNSIAGARALNHLFGSGGPYSMPASHSKAARARKFAEGGGIDGDDMPSDPEGVDIIAAGGEFIIDPSVVEAIGGGDMDKGHRTLDQFVKSIRARTIKEMSALPGPAKD